MKFDYRIDVASDVQPSRPRGLDLFRTDWTDDYYRFADAFKSLCKRYPESEGFRVRAVCRDKNLLEVTLEEVEDESRQE